MTLKEKDGPVKPVDNEFLVVLSEAEKLASERGMSPQRFADYFDYS